MKATNNTPASQPDGAEMTEEQFLAVARAYWAAREPGAEVDVVVVRDGRVTGGLTIQRPPEGRRATKARAGG